MKRAAKSGSPASVGKLLRVLVAGGVALAGLASPLAGVADEKAPPEKAAAEKTGDKGTADKTTPGKAAPAKDGDKKAGQEKKPATEEAGGVKGW